jgi:hypothetical protein
MPEADELFQLFRERYGVNHMDNAVAGFEIRGDDPGGAPVDIGQNAAIL